VPERLFTGDLVVSSCTKESTISAGNKTHFTDETEKCVLVDTDFFFKIHGMLVDSWGLGGGVAEWLGTCPEFPR
jgi:hypothetical protein